MLKFKVDVFTFKESFSCVQESETIDSVISSLDRNLISGIIKMVISKPRAKTEEVVIIPREKVDYITIRPLDSAKVIGNLDEQKE